MENIEYGEKLVVRRGWLRNGELHCYCFRKDPVPFIFRLKFGGWYKHPKTTQEKRLALVYPRYVRSKRNNRNLPSTWDDSKRGDVRTRKSWKNKKVKKQWSKKICRCTSMVDY